MRNISISLVLLITGVCGAQTQVDLAHQVKGTLPVAQVSAPGFTAGTNITITGTWPNLTFTASGGGLSSFTSGTGGALFTTSLGGSPTTAPALTFTLSSQAADSILGNFSGSSAAPTFTALINCVGSTSALNYSISSHAFTCATIGGISGLTTGLMPLAGSSTTIANSHVDDGVTTAGTVTSSEPVSAPSITATGTIPGGTGGGSAWAWGTGSTGQTGYTTEFPNASGLLFEQIGTATALQLITTGGDVNATNQVTSLHLSAALPIAQGGTNTTSLTPTTLTDGATVAFSGASALQQAAILTLVHTTSTRALTVSNLVAGAAYTIILKQDSTGVAGTFTLSTGCTWKVGGGGSGAIALSSTANAIDVLSFVYDGTNCYANLRTNFN